MQISELGTPVPVVDLDIASRNIRRLQEYCDRHRFKLRPHIKTHKLPFFAHEQCKAGAIGITVQKIGEAEVMAQTGLNDILITYNIIGEEKAERLANLTNFAVLSVAIDNEKALESLTWAARRAHDPIGVLIEFESGGNRQGVQMPTEAVELARKVLDRSGLQFRGLMTYPTTAETARFLEEALPLFKKAGIEVPVISGGGTPSAFRTHELAPVTELRVGTYIYNDRVMMAAQAASLEDCALTVLATVVSRPMIDRAIIDAGNKTLSSDLLPPGHGDGYGLLPDYPGAIIARLTPGFLPYPHGYHHEFAQVQSQPWLEMLLGLCFCNHCLDQSHCDTGIDSSDVRARVATMLDGYLESPCEVPPDMAYAWITADLLQDAELLTFLRWRMQRVSALVRQMRAVLPEKVALAIIPTVQRPTATTWLEGSNLKELGEAADFLEIPFYEPVASRAIADAWDSVRRVGGDTAKIRAIIRPGPPDLGAGKDTTAAIKGLAGLGIRNFAFYNWGLLRKCDFIRIGEALKAIS